MLSFIILYCIILYYILLVARSGCAAECLDLPCLDGPVPGHGRVPAAAGLTNNGFLVVIPQIHSECLGQGAVALRWVKAP